MKNGPAPERGGAVGHRREPAPVQNRYRNPKR